MTYSRQKPKSGREISAAPPFPSRLGKRGKIEDKVGVTIGLSILGFVSIIILIAFNLIPIGLSTFFFFLIIGLILLVLAFGFQFIGPKTLGFEEAFIFLISLAILIALLWFVGKPLLGSQFAIIQPQLQSIFGAITP